jgi:hypothetical protein
MQVKVPRSNWDGKAGQLSRNAKSLAPAVPTGYPCGRNPTRIRQRKNSENPHFLTVEDNSPYQQTEHVTLGFERQMLKLPPNDIAVVVYRLLYRKAWLFTLCGIGSLSFEGVASAF